MPRLLHVSCTAFFSRAFKRREHFIFAKSAECVFYLNRAMVSENRKTSIDIVIDIYFHHKSHTVIRVSVIKKKFTRSWQKYKRKEKFCRFSNNFRHIVTFADHYWHFDAFILIILMLQSFTNNEIITVFKKGFKRPFSEPQFFRLILKNKAILFILKTVKIK